MIGPDVTVVVVTFRGRAFLAECLASVAAQRLPHRLLVIDNASTDGTAELLTRSFPDVDVRRQATNLGFAGAVEVALDAVQTRWMALLNDDAVADPSWLAELVEAAGRHPEAAAVTSRMLLAAADGGPADRINNLGVALDAAGYGYDVGLDRPATEGFADDTAVFGFSGGAALIEVAALRAVGGSPAEFFLYYEDVDMSWRLRLAGREIISAPAASVVHRHSATIGQTSDMFHVHNERNRLLTLLRCAPLPFALRQLARFGLTTASLTVTRMRRRPVPPAANFRLDLRLRVIRGVLSRLPGTLAARHRIGRQAVMSRRDVAQRWIGTDPLTGHRP